MSRVSLIVNADDGNLTPGVFRGVLRAHDEGIVTSTTVFANLILSRQMRKAFEERPNLGVGVHLNITLGEPVSRKSEIHHLLAGKKFAKHSQDFFESIHTQALLAEYKAQIECFEDWLGVSPSHLDTHHHIHRFQPVFEVLTELALQKNISIRLCERVDNATHERFQSKNIKLADHLIADVDDFPHFSKGRLDEVLRNLPDGVVELMTHPAEIDDELRRISSFVDERAEELSALTQSHLISFLKRADIELVNYRSLVGKLS